MVEQQPRQALIHGTVVAVGLHGVLLRGASGAGKSDLALRILAVPAGVLLQAAGGWNRGHLPALVADDQVLVTRTPQDALMASAPDAIRGLLEVRGLGIVPVAAGGPARLVAVVDLIRRAQVERLPPPDLTTPLLGCPLPLARLYPFEPSAPLKVLLFLAMAVAGGGAGARFDRDCG